MRVTHFLEPLQEALGFRFKNPMLLVEALTHSYDISYGAPEHILMLKDNVLFKRKNFERLRILGTSVLKFIMTEFTLRHHNDYLYSTGTSTEGRGTALMKYLLEETKFVEIGKKLSLKDFIEVNYTIRRDPSFYYEKYFPDVIKAIFAAVFIDAEDMTSRGTTRQTKQLFYRLWKPYMPEKSREDYSSFPINSLFRKPTADISETLERHGHRVQDLNNLQKHKLSFTFKPKYRHILEEALTHGSVRQLPGLGDVQSYNRLEYLGDAIYQLVICEYLFWYYVNDETGDKFNSGATQPFNGAFFQSLISDRLRLKDYIRKMNYVVINDTEDFLESVIGAMYINKQGYLLSVKLFLLRTIELLSPVILVNTYLYELRKLPFSKRTYYNSRYHLNMYSQWEEVTKSAKTKEEMYPPDKQDTFKIKDFQAMLIGWNTYAECWKNTPFKIHKEFVDALTDETLDLKLSRERYTFSRDYCNVLEYSRVSLFRVLVRIITNTEVENYCYGNLEERIIGRPPTPQAYDRRRHAGDRIYESLQYPTFEPECSHSGIYAPPRLSYAAENKSPFGVTSENHMLFRNRALTKEPMQSTSTSSYSVSSSSNSFAVLGNDKNEKRKTWKNYVNEAERLNSANTNNQNHRLRNIFDNLKYFIGTVFDILLFAIGCCLIFLIICYLNWLFKIFINPTHI